jgi:hypothetical protein
MHVSLCVVGNVLLRVDVKHQLRQVVELQMPLPQATPLPRLPSLPDASPSDDDSGSQSSGKSAWWKMQKSKVGLHVGWVQPHIGNCKGGGRQTPGIYAPCTVKQTATKAGVLTFSCNTVYWHAGRRSRAEGGC